MRREAVCLFLLERIHYIKAVVGYISDNFPLSFSDTIINGQERERESMIASITETKQGGVTEGAGYGKTTRDIEIKFYSYKNGKGQETVYSAKDCVELSLESYTVPVGCDTYEKLKNQMKPIPCFSHNKMFYETAEVMKDYYAGKLHKDEVKEIFKEYCYHAIGKPSDTNHTYQQRRAEQALSQLYEYFSRANTRAANNLNSNEARALLEGNGAAASGFVYYNADYYWQCEEMQEMFREASDELADEYGANPIDHEYVKQNTKFVLDGGITYNGVWNATAGQNHHEGNQSSVGITDKDAVPPKGFLYFRIFDNGRLGELRESLTEEIEKLGKEKHTKALMILSGIGMGSSPLQKENGFLKYFAVNSKYKRNYMEFLRMEKQESGI